MGGGSTRARGDLAWRAGARRDPAQREARRDTGGCVRLLRAMAGLGSANRSTSAVRRERTSEVKAATSGAGTRCVPDGAVA